MAQYTSANWPVRNAYPCCCAGASGGEMTRHTWGSGNGISARRSLPLCQLPDFRIFADLNADFAEDDDGIFQIMA